MTWLRGKKWIKVWFVTSFQSYFWLKLFSFGSCSCRSLLPWIEPSLYGPLFNNRDSRITRRFRNFTKAKKSTDLRQGGESWLLPSVGSFGLSLAVSPLFLLGKFPALSMPFLNQFWLYNYWSNYSERCFGSQPFPPLLAKFYPLVGGMGVLVFALAIMDMPRIAT